MEEMDNDLTRLIDKCVQDANVYYTIVFDAPRTDKVDDYHALSVQVDKPELRAHANTGYYDQPVYYDQPRIPEKRVTVDELEKALADAQGESDGELAGKLARMELSERMSSDRLMAWKGRVHGAKAWNALVALADASAFLSPPSAEIAADAEPDRSSTKGDARGRRPTMCARRSQNCRTSMQRGPRLVLNSPQARRDKPGSPATGSKVCGRWEGGRQPSAIAMDLRKWMRKQREKVWNRNREG